MPGARTRDAILAGAGAHVEIMPGRMYAPGLGRFMQPDPIGYAGGANLYGYVGNDPLNRLDPLGLTEVNEGASVSGQDSAACTGRAVSDRLST